MGIDFRLPNAAGYRNRNRRRSTKSRTSKGPARLENHYLKYKLGESVTLQTEITNPSGSPHKVYSGQTGKIWSLSRRAVGVEFRKLVAGRIWRKRIQVHID